LDWLQPSLTASVPNLKMLIKYASMKFHLVFILAAISLFWVALIFGQVGVFWIRALAMLLGFFGFLFVFMLTDEISDNIRTFGIDLIAIGIGLMVIWI